ncbi:MAG: hypothetical protein Q9190_008062 [Brigantiaea leucoxantha]
MARPRRSTSKPSISTPLKRRASSPPLKTTTPSSRQSKRRKPSPTTAPHSSSTTKTKITPRKSQFFPPKSKLASDPRPDVESSLSEDDENRTDEDSGYEDEIASAVSSPPPSSSPTSEEDEDAFSSEEEEKPKARRRPQKNTKTTNGLTAAVKGIVEKGKELWRPGVKSNLAPGEAVFVKLPSARGDGGVPYEDGVIHPNTLLFLGDLAKNNDREWLKVHDADYRQSKKNWDAFVDKMTEKLGEKDETIPELPAKDLVGGIFGN